MKTQDFKIPKSLEIARKIILKGVVYECQGTLAMAMETTCSLTKDSFKGVCVGNNGEWKGGNIRVIGSKMSCPIGSYEESKIN